MFKAYPNFIKSKYLPMLEMLKQKITCNGKDFTNEQFADLLDVSLKTFNGFYNGKIIRFDLLITLGAMYEFETNITLTEK